MLLLLLVCRCPPKRPWQLYLRRPPSEGTPSLEERIEAANKLMYKSDIEQMLELMRVYYQEGAVSDAMHAWEGRMIRSRR